MSSYHPDTRSRGSPSPRRYSPPHDRGQSRGRDSRRDRSYSPRRRRSRPRAGSYRDRDREGYRSPSYDDYDYSRSRSPEPRYGGPPSRDVLMEGLSLELTEDDILDELKRYHDARGLEEARVIRNRNTGISRQFGFLHFATITDARRFLDRYHPHLYLRGQGESVTVQITAYRERETVDKPEDEWQCHVCSFSNFARRNSCRRCQAARDDAMIAANAQQYAYRNTGDSDVSPNGTPSQFLLFRGLEPTTSEELLGKGAAKLYKGVASASSAATQPKKSGPSKITSTTSDVNLGAKEGSLRRVFLVRDRNSDESWRYGFAEFAGIEDAQAALTKFNALDSFTISSKPIMLSFVHTGVFVPAYNYGPELDKFTFAPLNNPALKLAYWDEHAYVSELVLATEDPSANANAGPPAQESNVDGATKKRKATESGPSSSSKKSAPSHLKFWHDRHAELHGKKPQAKDGETADSSDKTGQQKGGKSKDNDEPNRQSFADLGRKCCLLCLRQFKTEAEVNKHERISQLHRDNLKNEDLKKQALEKLEKAKTNAESAAYRDRAKERRSAFNQPNRPQPSVPGNPSSTSTPANAATATTSTAATEKTTAPATASKGAALLGKMGWTEGEGLGAQGTGSVAPIATDLYVQGVGLGAAGGKVGDAAEVAARNTKGGYEGFQERVREGAKERFEKMG